MYKTLGTNIELRRTLKLIRIYLRTVEYLEI